MIRVQEQPFDAGQELMAFKAGKTRVGGTALFVGSVREMNGDAAVSAMTLEHYPGHDGKGARRHRGRGAGALARG
jgi:molybdopterin synthase catalytic subunit